MIKPSDIRVEQHLIKYYDDTDSVEPTVWNVAYIDNRDQMFALEKGLFGDNWDRPVSMPEWTEFDSTIDYYMYTYLGDTFESNLKDQKPYNDFYFVGDAQ